MTQAQDKKVEEALLKQKLAEEKKKREDDCAKEMQDVLKKYNCSVDVSMILKTTGAIPSIQIVAK